MTDGNARRPMALCLMGGGITGALYEVGCLAAMEEAFDGFQASQFDVVIGSSTGSTVALAIAGGQNAMRLYRALLDPADDFFPLQRNHLLRFDFPELRRMGLSGIGAFRRVISNATANPLDVDLWGELDRFYDSLPAGLFTLDAYEKFLEEFIDRRGIPKTLAGFDGKLLLVSNDLDAGERAVLGAGDLADVPTAKAVVASCATAPLFAPVRVGERDLVDGGLGDVAHVDLALERGSDFVVLVNPMVPIKSDPTERDVPTGHGKRKRVRDKGMLWVMNQSWRIRTHPRFEALFARFREEHGDSKFVLLEPDRVDAKMFLYSPMSFAARRVILEDGFRTTLRALRREDSPVRQMFLERGFVPKPFESMTVRPPAHVTGE
ncbi:MAG: patatin-like phospholipase family protein [Polyangiales bacterium]|nr:patatin-like phospholipase family protein [Myxococcales bacterium]